MIDAYEIGIRLALENGVSEGLAKVRQDLAMLDQAVAATARGLAQLHAVAGGAVSGAGAELPRMAAAVRPATSGATASTSGGEAALAPAAAASRVIERERATPVTAAAAPAVTVVVPDRVVPGAMPASMPASPSVAPAAATGVTAGGAARGSRDTPTPRVQVAPPAVVVQAPAPGPLAGATAPAPSRLTRVTTAEPARMAPERPQSGVVGAAPRVGAAALEAGRRGDAPRVRELPSPELAALGHAMLRTRREESAAEAGRRERVTLRTSEVPEVARRAVPLRATARQEVQRRPAAPTSWSPPASPMVAAAAAPSSTIPDDGQRAQAQSVPLHGDVFLDGVLMGRWMSEHMTREADRPPSGPTGFDARRSPAWPGATVGP